MYKIFLFFYIFQLFKKKHCTKCMNSSKVNEPFFSLIQKSIFYLSFFFSYFMIFLSWNSQATLFLNETKTFSLKKIKIYTKLKWIESFLISSILNLLVYLTKTKSLSVLNFFLINQYWLFDDFTSLKRWKFDRVKKYK